MLEYPACVICEKADEDVTLAFRCSYFPDEPDEVDWFHPACYTAYRRTFQPGEVV